MTEPTSDALERRRVVIENVEPEVDCGRFAVKRVIGDSVMVQADIFADGHDELACRLLYRHLGEEAWREAALRPSVSDRWQAEFHVSKLGPYVYKIEAWADRFRTWRRDLEKRIDAGQDVESEFAAGAALVREAAGRASRPDADRLHQRADALDNPWDANVRTQIAFDEALTALVQRYAPREPLAVYDVSQRVEVDRERAVYGAWYELFPRSTSPIPGKHGTFRTCITWLAYVAQMGFDVLYLPPVHPIGTTNRKGKNNAHLATHGDPGSPWAIGSEAGGHKAIDPELGTLADFHALVEAARGRDMEVALDLAFQVSPDHPDVSQHPEWFRHRPDGSIRFAENPPKRYEDIYPIDFETEDWRALWQEMESVVCFWIDQGVRIFRVDNPHTKPFPFWEWLIGRIKAEHPDVLFLAEAFTEPRTMQYLSKIGFSQSYTYFTWRNTKRDLTQFMEELVRPPVKEYFRPNLWPNTPDILNEYLQTGGRPAFVIRLILAATLSASYGIYGPPFELGLAQPREPESEEYRDSEKYEVRHWDVSSPLSLHDLIARLNRIRRENRALHNNHSLRFLQVNDDNLVAYMKASEDGENLIFVVVNLDPHNTHAGTLQVPFWDIGIGQNETYAMHDLLDGAHYTWSGEWNYVELNPDVLPAHILQLKRKRLDDPEPTR